MMPNRDVTIIKFIFCQQHFTLEDAFWNADCNDKNFGQTSVTTRNDFDIVRCWHKNMPDFSFRKLKSWHKPYFFVDKIQPQ